MEASTVTIDGVLEQERWRVKYIEVLEPKHLADHVQRMLREVPASQWSVSDVSVSHPTPKSALIVWKQGEVREA